MMQFCNAKELFMLQQVQMYYSRNGRMLQHRSVRRFVFTHPVASLFGVKWHHGCHLESVNRCIFSWRTFLPNFILKWLSLKFYVKGRPNIIKNNKMNSEMRSFRDLKIVSVTDDLLLAVW